MTEEEWLASNDPLQMVRGLDPGFPTWALPNPTRLVSDRKLRLLAAGCCREMWQLLADPRSRQAVIQAEMFIDGQGTDEERVLAASRAFDATIRHAIRREKMAITGLGEGPDLQERAATAAFALLAWSSHRAVNAAREALALLKLHKDSATALDLVRCVIGNPFGQPVIDPAWLAWNQGLVRHLAEGIYEEGRFREMGVLGDALEEGGCADENMLSHCRHPGPHARGCWIVDALLERS